MGEMCSEEATSFSLQLLEKVRISRLWVLSCNQGHEWHFCGYNFIWDQTSMYEHLKENLTRYKKHLDISSSDNK